MRRVVITGMGIVSSIGNDADTVLASLREGRSGIEFVPEYAELGMRSQVAGTLKIDTTSLIDRKLHRFMGDAAAYSYLAMQQAHDQSGLTPEQTSNPRTGLIIGSGGSSTANIVVTADTVREKGARRLGPYMVTRTMSSTTSACLATPFAIKGVNYSISSACATSAHCVGNAYELIQFGKQDVVFAGGGEELHWAQTSMFDAMGAISSRYNETAATASRPYDANRDGFVISGGAGVVVLEALDHALARGARILAEVVGYGATSDGYDMVAPSGEGAERCIAMALAGIDAPVSYINTHGTSTPAGDLTELKAMRNVFGASTMPRYSSTKSLTGHSLGAAGVHELVYSLLMLEHDFISSSAHIDTLDPEAADMPPVRERIDQAGLDLILSNSFGFGGTNASLAIRRYQP